MVQNSAGAAIYPFDFCDTGERAVPARLQFAGDQPVCGIGGVTLTEGAIGRVACGFEIARLLCKIDHWRLRSLDALAMRYAMPSTYEERADGLAPSAQSLRGYECAGRKRTFTNPDPMGDRIENRSAQNLKHLLSFSRLLSKGDT
jgi:hypothetical protein